MLRQLSLTAKRTMTRAGDCEIRLDEGGAIRERPFGCKRFLSRRLALRFRCVRVSGLLPTTEPAAIVSRNTLFRPITEKL